MVERTLKEVARLQQEGPTEDLTNRAKETARRAHETAKRQNGYWLGRLQSAKLLGRDPNLILTREQRIDAINRENIHEMFKKYFPMDRYTVVTLVPESARARATCHVRRATCHVPVPRATSTSHVAARSHVARCTWHVARSTCPARSSDRSLMLMTTTAMVDGRPISRYLGIVTGEAIIGANIFRDIFAGVRDIVGGRSGTYEKALAEARRWR